MLYRCFKDNTVRRHSSLSQTNNWPYCITTPFTFSTRTIDFIFESSEISWFRPPSQTNLLYFNIVHIDRLNSVTITFPNSAHDSLDFIYGHGQCIHEPTTIFSDFRNQFTFFKVVLKRLDDFFFRID